MKRLWSFTGVFALAACASNTGIVPIGDGLYMASKQDLMTYHGGKVKVELYQEATQFCAKQGKKSVPVSDASQDAVLYQSSASAEVKFRCI